MTPGTLRSAVPGDDTFLAATPSDLLMNCVVPQSLDDQWVPLRLVRELLAGRGSLADIDPRRRPVVRNEYVRVLVTARQVIVNRTYLFRNPVIYSDYLSGGEERDAFVRLLQEKAVVPFLLRERSPLATHDASDPHFAVASEAWNSICRQHPLLYCVRLSWDDTENEALSRQFISERFAQGVRNAHSVNFGELLVDEGDRSERRLAALRDRLGELRLIRRPQEELELKRTLLYEKFILVEGATVQSGLYDPGKPFVASVKSFLDLLYNANLANALGKALVTPIDTPHRSSLFRNADEDLAALRTVPLIMEVVQNALFSWTTAVDSLRPFDGMTLPDVIRTRESQQWIDYADALDHLLEHPWVASHPDRGIPGLFKRYRALLDYLIRREFV